MKRKNKQIEVQSCRTLLRMAKIKEMARTSIGKEEEEVPVMQKFYNFGKTICISAKTKHTYTLLPSNSTGV